MKAMILAAGRGERMRPLTDILPKALLKAGGKPLIVHQITALVAAGFSEIVINHAHLGEQLVAALGEGAAFGARITYSPEPPGALETGGAIFNALARLEGTAFVVVNADVWTDYPYARLRQPPTGLAHLVLVDNPPYHPEGDFALDGQGRLAEHGEERLTFSGIGVYRSELFAACRPGAFPLAPLLRAALRAGEVSGEHYAGRWVDVGTPARLATLDRALCAATQDE